MIEKINLDLNKFLILCFFLILLSINSNPLDIVNLNQYIKSKDVKYFLNGLRFLIPFLIFPLLIILIIYKNNKNKITIFNSLFIISSIWQLIILFFSDEKFTRLGDYQINISLICVAMLFHLTNHQKVKKYILIILMLYILALTSYFVIDLIKKFFLENDFYLYTTAVAEEKKFMQASPRATGISRTMLLTLYLCFIILINIKKIKFQIILYLISFVLMFLIYGLQSRGTFLGCFVLLFFYIFFFKKISLIKKIFVVLIIFIIPLITYEIIKPITNNYKEQKSINNSNRFFNTSTITNDDGYKYQDYTSGRIEIWKRSLKIIRDKKIILGYGPMSDRVLLIKDANKNKPELHFWDNNSSNALIYSYLSGGIISFISLVLIYFLTIKEILISTFIKKLFMNKDIFAQFAIITLSFLVIRSIFENSFALFGIDLIIFFASYNIVTKYKSIKFFN